MTNPPVGGAGGAESLPAAPPTCYRHTDRETWIRCQRCERPICPDCMNSASVGFHCPNCVKEANKGGLILSWQGIQGFLPASQLSKDHYPRVPEGDKDKIFGVIHIDSKIANYTFTEDQLRLFTAIGVHTARLGGLHHGYRDPGRCTVALHAGYVADAQCRQRRPPLPKLPRWRGSTSRRSKVTHRRTADESSQSP